MSAKVPSLTAVMHSAVKDAPSGLTARSIAELAGREYHTMMSELSRQPGHKLGADMVLPLMQLAGSDAPLNFLARERGGVYVPLHPCADTGTLNHGLLKSVQEFGQFAAEAAKNLADGIVPLDQLQRILKEGQEAATAIVTFMELARVVHESQYSRKG